MNIHFSLGFMLIGMMLYAPQTYADTPKELEDLLAATYSPATAQATKIARIIQSYANVGSVSALRYGDRVKLRHTATNRRLHGLNQPYKTNPQPGQFMAVADSGAGSWWIVKGSHIDGQRLTGNMWMPLTLASPLRLEHEATGLNLHCQANFMAPLAAQVTPEKELIGVSIAGSGGIGDLADNWKLQEIYGATEVAKGYSVKLMHTQTNDSLHSDILQYPDGFQEISVYPTPTDSNNWWTVEDIIPGIALDLNICCALYGDLNNNDDSKRKNVTDKLDAMIYNGTLRFPIQALPGLPDTSLYKTFNIADPSPDTIKNIAIAYSANSIVYLHLAASEYDIIALPDSRDQKIFDLNIIDPNPPSLKILYALYGDLNYTTAGKNGGAGNQTASLHDVTDKIQGMINNSQIIFPSTPKTELLSIISPAPATSAPSSTQDIKATDPDANKGLLIVYQTGNQVYMHILGEQEPALISPTNVSTSSLVYEPTPPINIPNQFQMEVGSGDRISVGSNGGVLEVFLLSPGKNELLRYNTYNLISDPWSVLNVPIGANKFLKSFRDVAMSSDNVLCFLDGNGKAYRYSPQNKVFVKLPPGAGNESLSLDFLAVGNTRDIWAVDAKSKTIYEYDTINSKWVAQTDQPGIYVAAGVDGSVIVISPKNEAFLFDGNAWQPLPGSKVDRVAIGSRHTIWGIRNGMLLTCIGGKWRGVRGSDGTIATGCKEIAVNAAGTVFVITNDGVIYFRGDAGFFVTKIVPIKAGKKVQISGKYIVPQNVTRSRAMAQGQLVIDTKVKNKTQKLNRHYLAKKKIAAKK